MMARVNREMVANILGAGWEAMLNAPLPDESSFRRAKEENRSVDTEWESRNNNN